MKKNFFWASLFVFIASCGTHSPAPTDLFPVKTGKQYGYIDRTGKVVIPYQYSRAGCFSDGLAVAATTDTNAKWGYVDKTGNYVITPTYSSAASFSEGIAFVVAEGGVPTAIDKSGAIQFTADSAAETESFSGGLAAYGVLVPDGEVWGFLDKRGKTAIVPIYRGVGYFSGNLCGAMNEKGLWGYIDNKGRQVIDFRYDNVNPFESGQAKVSLNGKWGIIDREGKNKIAPRYSGMDIDGDRYLVKEGSKWGWINKEGKAVIAAQFNDAFPFNSSAYAPVKKEGKWGYIDKTGKIIIAPQYDFAFGFDGGMALVETNGKYGFINNTGKYVVSPAFDNISLDYFIRSFASTSAFYNIKTNRNIPSAVAWRWLTHFYHMEYSDARKISTDETNALLEQFSGLTGMIADSSKEKMAGVIIGIKGAKEDGDRAIVTYTLSDNPGKDQLLFLVRKDGKWLVQFTKNDNNEVGKGLADKGK